MEIGRQKGIANVKDPEEWFLDLTEALQGVEILSAKIQIMSQISRKEIEAGTMDSREVANEMRQWAKFLPKPRSTRTALTVRYGGESEEEDSGVESTQDDQPRTGRTKRKADSQENDPRKRSKSNQKATGCRACGFNNHKWEDCWVLFPERARDGFRPPADHRKAIVERALNNKAFAKQVERKREEYQKLKETQA